MSKTDYYIFKGLYIISWLIFVGLCIEAGGLLVNFVFHIYNPAVVPKLYQKLDLRDIYDVNRWVFFGIYSFILFIAVLKSMMFYAVIRMISKLDLSKPFNLIVAQQISLISYYTFSIGLVGYVARQTVKSLEHHGFKTEILNQFWVDSQAYILMAAVIYIIAVIFKKGIALQTENDLTV